MDDRELATRIINDLRNNSVSELNDTTFLVYEEAIKIVMIGLKDVRLDQLEKDRNTLMNILDSNFRL